MLIGLLRLLLYPLFKWVYKYDFESSESSIRFLSSINEEQIKKIEELSDANKKYIDAERVMCGIISQYKWNYLSITKYNEPVVVSLHENNLQNTQLYLTKIYDNNSVVHQCHINTHHWETARMICLLEKAKKETTEISPMICLVDIISKERKKGYARELLSYLIKLAKEQKFKTIVGWLSYTDKDDHTWLKDFYVSLGFEVYLFGDDEGVIIKYL